jgi:hypothetical protein
LKRKEKASPSSEDDPSISTEEVVKMIQVREDNTSSHPDEFLNTSSTYQNGWDLLSRRCGGARHPRAWAKPHHTPILVALRRTRMLPRTTAARRSCECEEKTEEEAQAEEEARSNAKIGAQRKANKGEAKRVTARKDNVIRKRRKPGKRPKKKALRN